MDLSSEQNQAISTLVCWLKEARQPYISLGGFAGTGKTTLLSYFRKILYKFNPKLRIAFCAYTGKASRVLSQTLMKNMAVVKTDSCSTIHSLIYAPIIDTKGAVVTWKKKDKLEVDLIILDEASMVDRQIWEDLLSFGIPIFASGDHGQLPPIGRGFDLMVNPMIRLEQIHRQAAENPIIKLSMMARFDGKIPLGKFGLGVMKLSKFESETGQVVEEILSNRREDLLTLCGFNTTRVRLNKATREFQGFDQTEPTINDRVICLKNNWKKGLYNGMTGVIKRIRKDNSNLVDQIYEVKISLEDNTLDFEGKIMCQQFGAETAMTNLEKRRFPGELFDFGYALTVHKAQGSQARQVLLFEERNKHMTDNDWQRWLYTGITRAEEKLTIIG